MKPSELFFEKFLKNLTYDFFSSQNRAFFEFNYERILRLEEIYRDPEEGDKFLLVNLLEEIKCGDLNRITRDITSIESLHSSNVLVAKVEAPQG